MWTELCSEMASNIRSFHLQYVIHVSVRLSSSKTIIVNNNLIKSVLCRQCPNQHLDVAVA